MTLPAGVGDSQVETHLTEHLGETLLSPPQAALRILGTIRQGVGGRRACLLGSVGPKVKLRSPVTLRPRPPGHGYYRAGRPRWGPGTLCPVLLMGCSLTPAPAHPGLGLPRKSGLVLGHSGADTHMQDQGTSGDAVNWLVEQSWRGRWGDRTGDKTGAA